ncbi:MAG: flavodoxin domain-containing protein [Propionibacteriaceae bacterium]|jgi:hypothetical protein|nr:flavodoxin domain-containing protein [Propionibacteriaceae bacterium]
MTTAIVYASKHGSTGEIAKRIASHLADATLLDLADDTPDISEFATVVLGTAVYANQPMSAMKDFCRTALLEDKRIGLFAPGNGHRISPRHGSPDRDGLVMERLVRSLATCLRASNVALSLKAPEAGATVKRLLSRDFSLLVAGQLVSVVG